MLWNEGSMYDGMMPEKEIHGRRGYYPVLNAEEWNQLPAVYKAMEWEPLPDYHDNNKLKAIKAVIFDVVHMEPYKIRAKVSVHPQEVQKILFCGFGNTQCHLYSICGVELEGGTQYGAKWLQDSYSGAFAICAANRYVAQQGGFRGFVPSCIKRTEDGKFAYDCYYYKRNKTVFYEFSNPFPEERSRKQMPSLEVKIAEAARSGQDADTARTSDIPIDLDR